jgi:predicted house-cleaning NTP pyrophosphatase (Maf/HAM1 superfamily)
MRRLLRHETILTGSAPKGGPLRLDQLGTAERNVEQLMQLSRRTHELVGGIVLLDAASGEEQTHVDRQRLTMCALLAVRLRRRVRHRGRRHPLTRAHCRR